eukprot:Opistho-2@40692
MSGFMGSIPKGQNAPLQQPQQQQQAAPEKFVRVCGANEIPNRKAKTFTVDGREIAVFNTNFKYYALDQKCYHAGGPLAQGDIEDLGGGRSCVKCPWHSYRIVLETGEGLFEKIDPYNKASRPQTCSKGPRQRTHKVKVDAEGIYVAINNNPPALPSDEYAVPKAAPKVPTAKQ